MTAMADPGHITRLLELARGGDARVVDELLPVIYDELRTLARASLSEERPGHTLSPTALVHEAYIRLADQRDQEWRNRAHFFALAATLIRRILVDHARRRDSLKRGGGAGRITLSGIGAGSPDDQGIDVLALHEALEGLGALDERQARLVELRFFTGLSMEEAAAELGVSKRTAEADWTMARAWLHRRLSGGGAA
jgi:RNA polymerase sigma factor (TIGR02999 family)